MFEMGFAVGLGLIVMICRMSWKWKMRVISNPAKVDALIFVALYLMHSGSFAGVMVAAIGSLMCSVVLSIAKWAYGFIEFGSYIPGVFNISSKL